MKSTTPRGSFLTSCFRIVIVFFGLGLQQAHPNETDRAAQLFADGQNAFERGLYQEAERNFVLSLSIIEDSQTLYYRALSIHKQRERNCTEKLSSWRDYFQFCDQAQNNCVESWSYKASKYLSQIEAECTAQRNAQAGKLELQGSKLIEYGKYGEALRIFEDALMLRVSSVSLYYRALCMAQLEQPCPSVLSAWNAFFSFCERNKDLCDQRFFLDAQDRSRRMSCSPSSGESDSLSPAGSVWSPDAYKFSQKSGQESQQGSSIIPWLGLGAVLLGGVAHITNFKSTQPKVAKISYYATFSLYGLGGVGLSIGAYQWLTASKKPQETTFSPFTSQTFMVRFRGEF